MLSTFKQFLADEQAWDMYITGAAGSGKTTGLREIVQFCIDYNIPYVVCAYTHKACGILASKLPDKANIQTLHSYLGKRPGVNMDATKKNHVNVNVKVRDTDNRAKVCLLDEYSMVGEKDFLDIREAQDGDYDGIPELKVVWIGDSNQLPPVGGQQAINPSGDYCVNLTTNYRNDNPLQIPLQALISYIEQTTEPEALVTVPGYFERGVDLVEEYKKDNTDKVMLAYTNKRVQELNAAVLGRMLVKPGDTVFSPTTQKTYTVVEELKNVTAIDLHFGELLALNSKYKTLEHLIQSKLCQFLALEDEEGDTWHHAVVYGHYNFKTTLETLSNAAVKSNQVIEQRHKGYKASGWSRANATEPLARARSKAWRDFLTFKDCVICIDAPFAMTVHKSQGSTFETVYLDMQDLGKCANFNFELYLKLAYVGISRASNKVYTN